MSQEKSEVEDYRTFQDFLDRHPNPSRDIGDDVKEEDPLFGKNLAKRFLQELREHVTRRNGP